MIQGEAFLLISWYRKLFHALAFYTYTQRNANHLRQMRQYRAVCLWKSARVAELIVALSDIVKFDRVQVQSVAGFNKLPAAVVIHQQAGNALHLIELLGILQDVGPVYIDAPKSPIVRSPARNLPA